jgi:hypothetical protein
MITIVVGEGDRNAEERSGPMLPPARRLSILTQRLVNGWMLLPVSSPHFKGPVSTMSEMKPGTASLLTVLAICAAGAVAFGVYQMNRPPTFAESVNTAATALQDFSESLNAPTASSAANDAPQKAEPWNNLGGDIDPIVIQPGTLSVEVLNHNRKLQTCWGPYPASIEVQYQLPTGEWIEKSSQNGRAVSAVRFLNTGTTAFTAHFWRNDVNQPC